MTVAEEVTGDYITRFTALAAKHKIWLSLGGFQEKVPGSDKQVYNSHLIINAEGKASVLVRARGVASELSYRRLLPIITRSTCSMSTCPTVLHSAR